MPNKYKLSIDSFICELCKYKFKPIAECDLYSNSCNCTKVNFKLERLIKRKNRKTEYKIKLEKVNLEGNYDAVTYHDNKNIIELINFMNI